MYHLLWSCKSKNRSSRINYSIAASFIVEAEGVVVADLAGFLAAVATIVGGIDFTDSSNHFE